MHSPKHTSVIYHTTTWSEKAMSSLTSRVLGRGQHRQRRGTGIYRGGVSIQEKGVEMY